MGAVRDFIKHFYLDTTVYSQEAMELLIKVVGVDNIIYASEMLGGVNAIDPATGRSFDDNKTAASMPFRGSPSQDRTKIFEENVARRIRRLVQHIAAVSVRL